MYARFRSSRRKITTCTPDSGLLDVNSVPHTGFRPIDWKIGDDKPYPGAILVIIDGHCVVMALYPWAVQQIPAMHARITSAKNKRRILALIPFLVADYSVAEYRQGCHSSAYDARLQRNL
jgi:hypothetical protein